MMSITGDECNTVSKVPDAAGDVPCPRCNHAVTPSQQKICCKCGRDVSNQGRVKDGRGRYYCRSCFAAVVPDGAVACATCGQLFKPTETETICDGCIEAALIPPEPAVAIANEANDSSAGGLVQAHHQTETEDHTSRGKVADRPAELTTVAKSVKTTVKAGGGRGAFWPRASGAQAPVPGPASAQAAERLAAAPAARIQPVPPANTAMIPLKEESPNPQKVAARVVSVAAPATKHPSSFSRFVAGAEAHVDRRQARDAREGGRGNADGTPGGVKALFRKRISAQWLLAGTAVVLIAAGSIYGGMKYWQATMPDEWETENTPAFMQMCQQADAQFAAGDKNAAYPKYQRLILVGAHALKGQALKDIVDHAKSRVREISASRASASALTQP